LAIVAAVVSLGHAFGPVVGGVGLAVAVAVIYAVQRGAR
jgi:hypothetical protein